MSGHSVPIGSVFYWETRPLDPLDGFTPIDADSLPEVVVLKDGVVSADSVTFGKRAATTGIYDGSIDTTGMDEGDSIILEISGLINTEPFTDTESFTVAADNSGIAAIKAKTDNLPSDPASQAKLDELHDNRLTSARAGYLDKLSVSGTLAHSDAASTYKADVSALATTSQLNARTKATADYFDPIANTVTIGTNGVSAAALSDAAIAKIEAAFLNDEDGIAFKDALMQVIEDQLDATDISVLAIADTTINRLFAALVADHNSVVNSWGERFGRLPNAAAGSNGGLPTVDGSNYIAGIQGTLNTLDDLDTTQDTQHSTTQSAIAGMENLSSSDVQSVITSLGYTGTLATNLATTNTRVDVAVSTRSVAGDAMTLTTGAIASIWNALTSGLSTVNSIGKLLVDRMATILKLDATLESDGATYRFNSNALEQAPGGGGSLSGANTVTITVDDGINPLESARVRVTKGAQTEIRQTNGDGQVEFSLDDGTWTVAITLTGYTFTATLLAVSGDETATYSMTALALAPAETPAIRNYLIVRSLTTKAPIEGALVRLQQKTAPSSAGNAVAGGEVTASSNASGEAWFYVLPGETYTATLPDGGKQIITVESTAVDGDPLDSILISL